MPSSPVTSPSAPSSFSGMLKTPQVISSRDHDFRAVSSVYATFDCVQRARFSTTWSGSDEAIGEEQRELATCAGLRVRAVNDVLRELDPQIPADCARRRVEWIRRAHHRADNGDRRLSTHGESENRPRSDEVDEGAEEGLALVLRVVLA